VLAVNRTRLSLYYLAGYLLIIGLGLLLGPDQTLHLLRSNGHYGEVFPRLTGMLMSGLGLNIAGMIRARTHALYPATLVVRTYFVLCLVGFWFLERDPFFLVLLGIVLLGMALTWTSYLRDARAQRAERKRGGTGLPV
jgi:hypothetical protein